MNQNYIALAKNHTLHISIALQIPYTLHSNFEYFEFQLFKLMFSQYFIGSVIIVFTVFISAHDKSQRSYSLE